MSGTSLFQELRCVSRAERRGPAYGFIGIFHQSPLAKQGNGGVTSMRHCSIGK